MSSPVFFLFFFFNFFIFTFDRRASMTKSLAADCVFFLFFCFFCLNFIQVVYELLLVIELKCLKIILIFF